MVRCEECGKLGEGPMEGWRALLGVDIDDENEPTETYLFCPACAEREFDPPRGAHERSAEWSRSRATTRSLASTLRIEPIELG
jgi:hypothetical protein